MKFAITLKTSLHYLKWSKPHVSTTSLRGLHMFRDALVTKQCCVGLDETLSGGDFKSQVISRKPS